MSATILMPANSQALNVKVPPIAIAGPHSPTEQAGSPKQVCIAGPSKNWVLPPRAKPGRKPITDQPPTRRKAQNRAAQRAFRERRAARVGELEEELKKRETVFEGEKQELQASFESERQYYLRNVAQWRERAGHWEQQAQHHYDEVVSLRRQLEVMNFSNWGPVPSKQSSSLQTPTSLPLPTLSLPPIKEVSLPQQPQQQQAQDSAAVSVAAAAPVSHQEQSHIDDCGNCGADGKCACFEKVVNYLPSQEESETMSDGPRHPTAVPAVKQKPSYEELEEDFTARFARKPSQVDVPMIDADPSPADGLRDITSVDHCGFCTDETNCICSQAGLNVQSSTIPLSASDVSERNHKPSLSEDIHKSNLQKHQLPSLQSPATSIKLSTTDKRPIMEPSVQLTGPGTCPSCLANPEQRRFCQQLAGILPPPPLVTEPSSTPSSSNVLEFPFPHEVSLNKEQHKESISCADAYSRLRENPDFDVNKSNFGVLQNRKRHPGGSSSKCKGCNKPGCSARFDVDCASILTAMRTSGKTYQGSSQAKAKAKDKCQSEA